MDKVDLVNIYAHGLEGVEAAMDHELDRITALEAEVERLRVLLARFTDKCALATIPHLPTGVRCRHCGEHWGYGRLDRHTADCLVTQARKALEPAQAEEKRHE